MKIVADADLPFIQAFANLGKLILKPGREIQAEDLQDADVLIVRSVTRVDSALLKHTQVKFVGSVTAGADHLDIDWLSRKGIHYCTAPGSNAPPVAEYVASVIAACQKKGLLHAAGLKAAVIGVGQTGSLTAKHLAALGFETTFCDPLRAQFEADFQSTALMDLSDLDLISLHVPLTTTGLFPTKHMIDKTFLSKQRLGCVFINASRGAVIESNTLLGWGEHLHWCLDVFEGEPHIHPAILQKALIATPHMAGYSWQSKIRGMNHVYQAACQFFHRSVVQPSYPNYARTLSEPVSSWQDAVLAVFDPLTITAKLKASPSIAQDFDALRQAFNQRYEFSQVTVPAVLLAKQDQLRLQQLGFRLSH